MRPAPSGPTIADAEGASWDNSSETLRHKGLRIGCRLDGPQWGNEQGRSGGDSGAPLFQRHSNFRCDKHLSTAPTKDSAHAL